MTNERADEGPHLSGPRKGEPPRYGVVCCFCGTDVEADGKDLCQLTVTTENGKCQMWFCHAACFREKIHKDPMLEPYHF
jgi:hypothetical protein